MKSAIFGGLALVAAAAAMVTMPKPPSVEPKVTSPADGQERPMRPNRPDGLGLSVSYPTGGRRPLGAASLVTQGQASLGFVTVGGFVRQPGRVSCEDGDTLFQVIAKAGGATEFSSLRRVKLFREGKVYQFDLTGKDPEFPTVQSGDAIEVPQKMVLGR